MRLFFRFILPLVVALGALTLVLSPLVDYLVRDSLQGDAELRSRLIFNATQSELRDLDQAGSRDEMAALFEDIAKDERILAIGWCSPDGELLVASNRWPAPLRCPAAAIPRPTFAHKQVGDSELLVGQFPMVEHGITRGYLLIVHDLAFVDGRSFKAQLALVAFLVLVAAIASAVALGMARLTWRRPVHPNPAHPNEVHHANQEVIQASPREIEPTIQPTRKSTPEIRPMIGAIWQALRDLDLSRSAGHGVRVEWSPDSLRTVLGSELPGAEVLVVSNREPYTHTKKNDAIKVTRPASGLVTALEPIIRACGGTWIAHGSGSADQLVVDDNDRVPVPPDNPSYTLRRIWLSEEEESGYYYGLANEGLWPLCHISFVRPVFRESDWEYYVSVNKKFADAVVAEARTPDPVILCQDYHFALLPRFVRDRLPQATIITFWHIPWPNSEVFSICPWRETILDGLLGSSIIGFHTQLHCNNFIDSADRFIECHIDREHSTISVRGHKTLIRPYPISIDWPPAALAKQASVETCRKTVRERLNLPADTLLGVGVERFDFTKGIPDRIRAVGMLLEKQPEWIGRFVFLQIAAPTRSALPVYQAVRDEAVAVTDEINAQYQRGDYKPVILIQEHHEPDQVFELFRAADLCVVSSLHDGMNLVAKEFVAARDDEMGVLVLSTFAGASRELLEALIVNPYDTRAMAEAMQQALHMAPEQQRERMRLMRQMVRDNNVYFWAAQMLMDAARVRRRQRIESGLATVSETAE